MEYSINTQFDTSPNAARVASETVTPRDWLEQWPPVRRSLISNRFHYAVRDGAIMPALVVRAVQTALHQRLRYATPPRNATDETLHAVWQALQAAPQEAYAYAQTVLDWESLIRDKQTHDWLKPAEGMHVYVLTTGDVARFKELAKVRLWLAGTGYCKLATPHKHTGVASILERCLIDMMVFSPERLDSVAGAQIAKSAPFYQDRPAPELSLGVVLDLDALPDSTEDERTQYALLVAEAKDWLAPEQRRIVRTHITSATPAIPDAEVEQEITARLARAERGELDAAQPLYFSNGTTCTAGTLTKALDGKRLRDPLEPDYGPSQAVLHWRGGDWRIVRWAHGIKRVYRLATDWRTCTRPWTGTLATIQAEEVPSWH